MFGLFKRVKKQEAAVAEDSLLTAYIRTENAVEKCKAIHFDKVRRSCMRCDSHTTCQLLTDYRKARMEWNADSMRDK